MHTLIIPSPSFTLGSASDTATVFVEAGRYDLYLTVWYEVAPDALPTSGETVITVSP